MRSRQPPTDDELAVRCLLDTAERTALGIWVYPSMWLILSLVMGLDQRWPLVAWGNVAGLLGLACARALLNRHLADLLRTHRLAAEWAFKGLTLTIAAYWGTLTGVCMVLAPGEPISWMMLTLTVAFCAGGNTLFGINASLRYPYPLSMIIPVVIAQFVQPTAAHKVMMVIEVALMAYLSRSSALVHKDYWDARHAQRLSAQQARELELASLTDGLTQIPNRIYFDRQFAHEWARQCRHGAPLSVMIVDLDHFKQINDRHGHPFGDQCLQAVARALQQGCGRSTDFVARYGGEEFVVLLTDTDGAGAAVVAERMRQQVQAISMPWLPDGQAVALTCSVGLCTTLAYHGVARDTMVIEADKALYRAKAAGRNRVERVDRVNEVPPLRRMG